MAGGGPVMSIETPKGLLEDTASTLLDGEQRLDGMSHKAHIA